MSNLSLHFAIEQVGLALADALPSAKTVVDYAADDEHGAGLRAVCLSLLLRLEEARYNLARVREALDREENQP